MTAAATVFIVDDDESVRKGLANLVRSAGHATRIFASGREFLEHVSDEAGCVILDLQMPEMGGLEVQAALSEQGVYPPVIFLTGQGNVSSSVKAMKKGAVDFLEKPVEGTVLLAAVADALDKDRQNHKQFNQAAVAKAQHARLSPRELEVLRYVIGGSLNKQIAWTLDISEKTVKAHRARVMEKMEVRNIPDLVRLAEKAGVRPATINTPKVQ